MTAVCVAHGVAVPAIRRVHDAFAHAERTTRIDLIDGSPQPRLDEAKSSKMVDGFRKPNAVLILGLSEWSNVGNVGWTEHNPGDSHALFYATGSYLTQPPTEAVATCLVTDSLDRLDPILALRRSNFEKRDKVRLVAVYGQEGGRMGRKVYESLIKRFPNLSSPNFLCFKTMDDKAARLIASRIRTLV